MIGEAEKALRFFFERGAPEGVFSAYYYSGRQDGGTSRESDLDVAVLLDPESYPERKERSHLRVSLASNLIHALRDNHVDLVVLNDAPPHLGRQIVTDWIRFYCPGEEADHAFAREVQLRAADPELYPAEGATSVFVMRPKPFLEEGIRDIRKYVTHLRRLNSKISGPDDLAKEFSLRNDFRYSILRVAQMVIDIAGELSVRHSLRFEDFSEAIQNLGALEGFPPELASSLEQFPGLRTTLLHPRQTVANEAVIDALQELDSVEAFVNWVEDFAIWEGDSSTA